MKTYPYIGKNSSLYGDFSIAIFYGENRGALLENTIDEIPLYEHTLDFNEREFKNITREYLTNTKVKIESEEHSELVQNLVFNAGGSWLSGSVQIKNLGAEWHFIDSELLISNSYQIDCNKPNVKLIAIPLPPRYLTESQKDWPQVGDSALTSSKQKVSVLAIHGGEAWVKYDGTPIGTGYASVRVATLSKPPTPEEELDRKLYDFFQCNSEEDLAEAIINGEIEGLEYKPQ